MSDRRAFLKFVAASPLLAAVPSIAEAFQQGGLNEAADALDVFDFQTAAQKVVPPAHWGYLMTGVDGEETLKANRDGYGRYQLRTKRFVDVSTVDMFVDLFGSNLNSPRSVSMPPKTRPITSSGCSPRSRKVFAVITDGRKRLIVCSVQPYG